jgi:putative ABC transport system permease protein
MPEWTAYVRAHLPPLGLRPEREAEIVAELALQLEQACGHAASESEALALAGREFPDWSALAAEIRTAERPAPKPLEERGTFWSGLLLDLRVAVRRMAHQPAFTATAVLAIALGIGGCTAIFSLLEAVVLRPLDYHEAERLVMVWERNYPRDRKQNVISPANFLDWQSRSTSFAGMSPVLDRRQSVTGAGEPEELAVQAVSSNFLSLLGVRPVAGRDLLQEDDRPGAARVVLISHGLWQRKYGADPAVLGRTLVVGGAQATIVGVLPPGFRSLDHPPDILGAIQLDPARDYRKNSGRYLRSVGRLKPGVSLDQAQGEMSGIAKALEVEFAQFDKGWGVTVVPLETHFSAGARNTLWVLMAAVGLVLLIACANVANLLLARAAAREREMAVRASLGARPMRLIRQLLTESLLLSLGGAAIGTLLALAILRAFQRYGPQEVPRLDEAGLHAPVLLFTMLLAVVTTALFGLAPALVSARRSVSSALKEGGRGPLGRPGGQRLLGAFVVAEVALALILLAGAGLLLRSFLRLTAVSPGFDAQNVFTLSVILPSNRYRDDARILSFFAELNARVGRLPGVESASSITFLPFSGPGSATSFRVEGRPEPAAGESPVTDVRIVEPGYFSTMRIPLRQGRLFTGEDNRKEAPLRFLVNETLARSVFPSENPIGKRLSVSMQNGNSGEIVGVVGDTLHYGLDATVRPMVYYPHAQLTFGFMTVVARTSVPPDTLVQPALAILREMDPEQPASNIRSMEDWIGRSVAQPRWLALLTATFAAIAALLALIGIYGVMSYAVEQHTHEIGLRLALGADPADMRALVIRRGMMLASLGLAIGLVGALASGRLLADMLFEIRPADWRTYAAAVPALAAIAWLASWIPARRATRIDPLVALRYE